MATEWAVLEGLVSVRAALESQNRCIHAIYISRDKWKRRGRWDKDVAAVEQLEMAAKASGIDVKRAGHDVIASHAGGKSHGGIIALVGPRTYIDLHELTEGISSPFIVMLDGIEDPFNFGYAVRSLYAAGVDGLVVRPRNWMTAAGVVARASAGSSERIPTAVAPTALDAATVFKEQGLTIAGTAQKQAVSIYSADLSIPLFLLIGGEKRGITRSFLDQADVLLEIPYRRPFAQSLGLAAAAAVLSFEIMRQRRYKAGQAAI